MRPVVDRGKCIGCALCAETCPEVFRLDEDDLASVIVETPGHEQYDCIREAAEVCPVEAISIAGA